MPVPTVVPLSAIVTVNDNNAEKLTATSVGALNGDRATALHAASQASQEQLAQMKREISELEQQVMKGGESTANLAVTASAVLTLYLSFGALQEGLIKHVLNGRGGWFLTFVQFLCYTIFSIAQHKFSEKRRAPLAYYCILALLQVIRWSPLRETKMFSLHQHFPKCVVANQMATCGTTAGRHDGPVQRRGAVPAVPDPHPLQVRKAHPHPPRRSASLVRRRHARCPAPPTRRRRRGTRARRRAAAR